MKSFNQKEIIKVIVIIKSFFERCKIVCTLFGVLRVVCGANLHLLAPTLMPIPRLNRPQVPFLKSSVRSDWESIPANQHCLRVLNQLYHLARKLVQSDMWFNFSENF